MMTGIAVYCYTPNGSVTYLANLRSCTLQEDLSSGGTGTMAFTGDLEHLPIVDVIQLMNSSRKSGILTISGRKGNSQLVFKDGYIVSASHLNNSVRIGQILVDMALISPVDLELALQKQQLEGKARKPLIITMIELGLVREEDAYKGLQQLIEMTIVEILTWKKGKFTLESLSTSIECEFRFYPDKMNHEINLNTQSMLMDALRVFDEKMRDGLLQEELPEENQSADELLSEDDLGLSEIDHLANRLPQTFASIAPFDPIDFQQEKLRELAPALPDTDREKLALFLKNYTSDPGVDKLLTIDAETILFFSSDGLLIHALGTVSDHAGFVVSTTDSEQTLEELLEEGMKKGRYPFIIFDACENGKNNGLAGESSGIRTRAQKRHPDIYFIQLSAEMNSTICHEAYKAGARAVIPRPVLGRNGNSFTDELISLLEIIPAYLSKNG